MSLHERWFRLFNRFWDRLPAIGQAVLIPWLLIGIVVALIPDLQEMPAAARFLIGLPLGLVIVWAAVGLFLHLADRIVSLGLFLKRQIKGSR